MNEIHANAEAMMKYSAEIPEITQALSQQCNKLIQALDAAAPYIKAGSGNTTAKKLMILRAEVEEMMRLLPAIDETSETTGAQAQILNEIIDLVK